MPATTILLYSTLHLCLMHYHWFTCPTPFQRHTAPCHVIVQAKRRATCVCAMQIRTIVHNEKTDVYNGRLRKNVEGEQEKRSVHTTYLLQHTKSPVISYLEHHKRPKLTIQTSDCTWEWKHSRIHPIPKIAANDSFLYKPIRNCKYYCPEHYHTEIDPEEFSVMFLTRKFPLKLLPWKYFQMVMITVNK